MDDHLTKTNVCYLLSSCQVVGHKCDGCWSGSRWQKEGQSPDMERIQAVRKIRALREEL